MVTDPDSSVTSPITIEAPETGAFKLAVGTAGSNVVVTGDGTAEITIGNAKDADGGELDASGSSFHIADDYRGTVIANLEDAIVDGTVDTTADTGNGSIADNGPTGAGDVNYYINSGAANDQIGGSKGADFVRLGAGDDTFNTGAGNDIVRVGTGDDTGSLGKGDDLLYLTVDQIQGESTNTIKDFDSAGNDKIQIEASLEGLTEISGLGTKEIKITLSGAQTGTTTIVSGGETIDEDDIEFV